MFPYLLGRRGRLDGAGVVESLLQCGLHVFPQSAVIFVGLLELFQPLIRNALLIAAIQLVDLGVNLLQFVPGDSNGKL